MKLKLNLISFIKIVIIIILAVVITIFLEHIKQEDAYKQAIQNFEQKYNLSSSDYEISKISGGTIWVYVKSLMEQGETAILHTSYSLKDPNKVLFYDNLFGYVIRDDYEKIIEEIVKTKFDNVKIYTYFTDTSFDDSLTMNSTLDDAYKKGEILISNIYIIVNSSIDEQEFKNSADNISDIFDKNNIVCTVRYCEIPDETEFNKINRTNYEQILEEIEDKLPFDTYKNRMIYE